MEIVLAFIVGAIIGFVGGFLVFRNNQKKFNDIETRLEVYSERLNHAMNEIEKDRK